MQKFTFRPVAATVAFWIWLLSAILGMASVINLLVAMNVLATMASVATEDVEAYLVVTGFGTAVSWIAVIGAAVQVVLSIFFRDGFNWARIALTVVAVLSLGLLFAGPGDIFGWIYVAANVAAVVCSFVPDSNAYFGRSRRRRTATQAVAA